MHRSLRVHFLAAVNFHREAEIDENNNSDPYRVVTVYFRTRPITLTTTEQQPLLQPDLVDMLGIQWMAIYVNNNVGLPHVSCRPPPSAAASPRLCTAASRWQLTAHSEKRV